MIDPNNTKATVAIQTNNTEVQITIKGSTVNEASDSWTLQAQKAIAALFANTAIKDVYYVDDIFELEDNFNFFYAEIQGLIQSDNFEQLKTKITDINFELPDEALEQELKRVWDTNVDKRDKYLEKLFLLTKKDSDFQKDIKAKNRIEEYFPKETNFHKLSPTTWFDKKGEILSSLSNENKTLFLFDNIFKHSPGLLANKKGLEFITEIVGSENKEKIICGLLTHTVEQPNELSERRKICKEQGLPIEYFFLLSKGRSERALQFADGIKKALLNTSCEIIKSTTLDIIRKAQEDTIKRLNDLDAYAFDHIIINSSFEEGIWELETMFRINNFLFKDFAKEQILQDEKYRQTVNVQLEQARAIGRIQVTGNTYNDHLFLRNQEIYESDKLINQLNSPIETGDIFNCIRGKKNEKYILVTQQCDLMVRNEDGERKSMYGTLLKINEMTETSLRSDIKSYNKKDVLRQHYFANKYKLPYFENDSQNIKVGIVDFNDSVLIDMAVLDLAVLNENGHCKIDFNNLPNLTTQLQSSWRRRQNLIIEKYNKLRVDLEEYEPILERIPEENKEKFWLSLMPMVSFIDELGLNPSYKNKVFDFGIQRVKRLRNPHATILLNKFTRHLSREVEDHDFAL